LANVTVAVFSSGGKSGWKRSQDRSVNHFNCHEKLILAEDE